MSTTPTGSLGAFRDQERRTCPTCGEDVVQRVARATFDGTQFSRRPRSTSHPVVVRCANGHQVEYAPVPDLALASEVRSK